MTSRRDRRNRISEAQANAEALARRDRPFAAASDASRTAAWDFRARQPKTLREAVHAVRRAYADEVPERLHDGPGAIGPDGTPRMTAKAEGYIFGAPTASDARRDPASGDWELVSYFHAPFRAALAGMHRGDELARRRASIVEMVAVGQQGPREAAVSVGVPPWCARLVAEDSLRAFLLRLSDLKVAIRQEHAESAA